MPQELRDSLLYPQPEDCLHLVTPPTPNPLRAGTPLGVRVWIWGGPRAAALVVTWWGWSEGFPGSGGLIRQQVFLLETPGMTGSLKVRVVNLTYLFIRGEGHASHLASLPCAKPCLPPPEGPNETMDVKTLQKV